LGLKDHSTSGGRRRKTDAGDVVPISEKKLPPKLIWKGRRTHVGMRGLWITGTRTSDAPFEMRRKGA